MIVILLHVVPLILLIWVSIYFTQFQIQALIIQQFIHSCYPVVILFTNLVKALFYKALSYYQIKVIIPFPVSFMDYLVMI